MATQRCFGFYPEFLGRSNLTNIFLRQVGSTTQLALDSIGVFSLVFFRLNLFCFICSLKCCDDDRPKSIKSQDLASLVGSSPCLLILFHLYSKLLETKKSPSNKEQGNTVVERCTSQGDSSDLAMLLLHFFLWHVRWLPKVTEIEFLCDNECQH